MMKKMKHKNTKVSEPSTTQRSLRASLLFFGAHTLNLSAQAADMNCLSAATRSSSSMMSLIEEDEGGQDRAVCVQDELDAPSPEDLTMAQDLIKMCLGKAVAPIPWLDAGLNTSPQIYVPLLKSLICNDNKMTLHSCGQNIAVHLRRISPVLQLFILAYAHQLFPKNVSGLDNALIIRTLHLCSFDQISKFAGQFRPEMSIGERVELIESQKNTLL